MMNNSLLFRALWACVDAEILLEETLSNLTELRAKIPDEFNSPVVDLLDKLHAATHHLQAAKYNVLIGIRSEKK